MRVLAYCRRTNDITIFDKLRPFLYRLSQSIPSSYASNSYRCFQKMAEITSTPPSTSVEPAKDEVVARLRQTDATEMLAGLPQLPASVTRAAVLVPLFYRSGKLHVLLTLRSSNLKSNRGEVSFPGGKCDEEDADFKATALRETEEEVGLPRDGVQAVSQLGPAFARRGTVVVPIVGFIPDDFTPVPNPAEVQDVFSMPLLRFLRAEKHFQRVLKDPAGHEFTLNFFNHSESGKQFTTFGLTASLCIVTAAICYASSPDFDSPIKYDSGDPRKILNLSQASYMRHLRRLEEAEQQGKL